MRIYFTMINADLREPKPITELMKKEKEFEFIGIVE
jgi:hypothetical protein